MREAVVWIPITMVVLAAAVSCGRRETVLEGGVVAQIGKRVILKEDLEAALALRRRIDPGFARRGDSRETVLQEMIGFEALYEKATREGFDREPQVAAAIRELVVRRYREAKLGAGVDSVGDVEIEAYYKSHIGQFEIPEARRGALVYIHVPRTASRERRAELRARAEAIRREAQAKQNEDGFLAELARRYSDDQATRYAGGGMGWVEREERGRWDAKLVEALFALPAVGQIGPLVETEDGLYVVGWMEGRQRSCESLASAREKIAQTLQHRRREQQKKALLEEARQEVQIRIHRSAVESLVLAEPAAPAAPPRTPAL